jgi:hypothetical protein
MSFIRPELASALARWREPLVWGGVMALGLALAWRGYAGGGALLIVVGALASGVALGLLVGALGRQAVRAAAPGPGIVAIDEGRIGYLGPRDGGYVDLPTLVEVALVERAGGAGRAWVLRSDDGTALEIPLGAVGAERLPDALAALPGFDLSRGVTALARPGGRHKPVWTRAATGPSIGRDPT